MKEKKKYEQYGKFLLDTQAMKLVKLENESNFQFLIDPVVFAWSVDPLAHKYASWSPYVAMGNNPIYFIDSDGREPREGNQVLKVDFNRAFISVLRDPKPKLSKYDPHLLSSALDRVAHVTLIGPQMRGPEIQQKIFEMMDIAEMIEGSFISKTNTAYAWLKAAKSSTGYEYVEFNTENNLIVKRNVENLNSQLGVSKGFENIVTRKQTIELDDNGNQTNVVEEYWNYSTKKNDNGETTVIFEHYKIDKNGLQRSGEQIAIPSKYDPNEK